MNSQETVPANGFKTLVDTIVAPKEAFTSISALPTWGWALVVTLVLGIAGSILISPATTHALAAGWPQMMAQNPRLAELSPAQQQAQLAVILKFAQFGWIALLFMVPLIVLLQTVLLAIFNALGRGTGTFAQYWAACANIGVPAFGLYSIVSAIIVLARGADSFTSIRSLTQSMPSLAMLAPGANIKIVAALAAINPFAVWGAVLAAIALVTIGKVPRVQAWLAGILWVVLPALFSLATAR